MPKYLFTFQKGESVRWLGHLDILRAFERAIRRAELPVAFTLGFNPRIRINFAAPLSTGLTGSAEPAVIELSESIPCQDIDSRLNEVLPPGIRVQDVTEIADAGRRDLLNSFDKAEYELVCGAESTLTDADLLAVTDVLLSKQEFYIEREREGRTKRIDIRPLISSLAFSGRNPENGRIIWRTVVGIGEAGNVKPADVVTALCECGASLTLRRAHRVRLLTTDQVVELTQNN